MNITLNYKSKWVYYLALFFIILMLYRNSLLPFGLSLGGKEVYVVSFLSFGMLFVSFDFNQILNQDIIYHFKKNFAFISLFFLLFISTILFNFQELTNKYYLIRNFAFIFYFVIYFVIFPKFLIQNQQYFRKFIFLIVCYGGITGSFALFLLFANLNPPGQYHNFAISYIWHPNISAFVYTVSIIATIYFLHSNFKNLSSTNKTFAVIALSIQVLSLLLTYCRAGVIGVIIGISIYFTIVNKRKIILLLPFLAIVVPIIIRKFFLLKGLASVGSRYILIISAIHMIEDSSKRFLWGYGVTDTFRVYKQYMYIDSTLQGNINNPHNTLLSLVMMFGIVFTIVLLTYIVYLLINILVRSWKIKNVRDRRIFAFLISSLVALIVHNLFDGQIIMPEFFCMQFFLIYLGLTRLLISEKTKLEL